MRDRFVFCPTPHTGSTAISRALLRAFTRQAIPVDAAPPWHPRVPVIAEAVEQYGGTDPLWFTVNRNPYDLLVTWYYWQTAPSFALTFNEWLRKPAPCGWFIVDGEILWYRKTVLDRGGVVLRYEDGPLDELLGGVLDRVGLQRLHLKQGHHATPPKTGWRHLYDDEAFSIVRDWLGTEIEEAGYEVL